MSETLLSEKKLIPGFWFGRELVVTIQLHQRDKGPSLSFQGEIGSLICGQIRDYLLQIQLFSPGWDTNKVKRLQELWQRWHLNDMRAGCEHQREAGWDKKPINPELPLDSYGQHLPGKSTPSWNMLIWVRRDEHPEGLLCEPCPICGYKYGTSWLYEPIPKEVLEEIGEL